MRSTCKDGVGATDDVSKSSDKSTVTVVGGSFPSPEAHTLKKGIRKKKKKKNDT